MKHRLLSIVALVISCSSFAETHDLVIRNVTIIDADAEPLKGSDVFVSGGIIRRIAPAAASSVSGAIQTLDGTGQYLIPGLWDMHVHIVYEDALVDSMPDLFLDYGITSVRDTGALLDRIAPQVKRWRELGPSAPDLYFSGPLLDGSLVVYDGDGRPEIGIDNASVDRALANFAALKAAGVDLIKIYELVSPEVFEALVSAAVDAGLPIAAHVPLSMTASTAGPRVGSMEHLRNIEIECADNAAELHEQRLQQLTQTGDRSGHELRSYLHSTQRAVALQTADPGSPRCREVLASLVNTIQVPTLRLNTITQYSPLKRGDWTAHLERLPPELAKRWFDLASFYAGQTSELGDQMSAWSMSLVDAMNRQGVPVGAGTDTPIGQAIPGYSLHTELERLVEAGLSNRQALKAATVRPAEFFGIEDQKGRIAIGMEADLLLLSKDPTEDIRHTRLITNVISDGVVVR